MRRYRAVIVGDAHFGAKSHQATEPERRQLFIQFVEEMAPQTERLVLIGDVFDFWFEYPGVVPDYAFEVLAALARATRYTHVVYLRGNHDLWAHRKMASLGEGVDVRDVLEILHGNHRIQILHGHQLSPRRASRFFHALIAHPIPVALYRWLHPALGLAFARWVARLSRFRNSTPGGFPPPGIHRIPADILILGHYHVPRIQSVGDQVLVVAGDWLVTRSYVTLDEHAVAIHDYRSDQILDALNLES